MVHPLNLFLNLGLDFLGSFGEHRDARRSSVEQEKQALKWRYKVLLNDEAGEVRHGVLRFNMASLSEVLTGDDSAYLHDLEVEILGQWKCLRRAFRDKDLISDNLNTYLDFPHSEKERIQGWNNW